MEYALEDESYVTGQVIDASVLILVLMEYALEGKQIIVVVKSRVVLILVLMEYALEAMTWTDGKKMYYACLNPCFNGICSRSAACCALLHLFLPS